MSKSYVTPIATSTGIAFAGDIVTGASASDSYVIPHVRVVYGATGSAGTNTTTDNRYPVSAAQNGAWTMGVSGGTATIGTVNINAIPAGTATVGSVIVSSIPALVAGTATVGSVLISPSQSVLVSGTSLEAGTATVGTVALQAAAAVALNAGSATIGTVLIPVGQQGSASSIPVVIASDQSTVPVSATGVALLGSTATVGSVLISANQTVLVSGTVLEAGTATVGTVALQAAAALALNAGTATIGTVNIQTATTIQVSATGIPLTAGTATIGTVNVANKIAPSPATNTRGPLTVAVTASGTTTLVSGVAGQSIYITALAASNRGATLRTAFGPTGDLRYAMNLASGGGGFVQNFEPAWQLATGARLVVVATDAITADVNVHFYVQ